MKYILTVLLLTLSSTSYGLDLENFYCVSKENSERVFMHQGSMKAIIGWAGFYEGNPTYVDLVNNSVRFFTLVDVMGTKSTFFVDSVTGFAQLDLASPNALGFPGGFYALSCE